MPKKSHLIIGIILLIICHISAERSLVQYSKVNIHITNPEDVERLQIAGLGLDHFKVFEESIEVILSSQQIDILNTTGTRYEILIDDVIEHYNQNVKMSDEVPMTAQESA